MSLPTSQRSNPLYLVAAFASGGLLAIAVFLNGEAGRYGGPMFASWLAHSVGTVVGLAFLAVIWRYQRRESAAARAEYGKPPLWSYLGGIIGAATVMLTSTAVNSPLALAGTIALGLAGQVALSLAADFWGLLGLPRRRLDWRDAGAVVLISAGSLIIILFGPGAAP